MKTFLQDLETELTKKQINKDEIKEILADHKEMIDEAISEGLSEDEIVKKFGSPEQIADECAAFTEKNPKVANESRFALYKSFPVLSDQINLNIVLVDEDFEIVRGTSSSIEVLYSGKGKIEDYTIELVDETFTLRGPKNYGIRFFNSRRSDLNFLVKLPNILVSNFLMNAVNSDAKVSDIKISTMESRTTNGDLDFNNITAVDVKLDTVNGDIKMKNYNLTTLKFSAVSGDVLMSEGKIEDEFKVNTVSGDFHVKNSKCNKAYFTTVSGDIVGDNFYPDSITMKSVSGDITIKNTDMTHIINIESKKSVSGTIKIVSK
ncbi:MAG: DUF4097 family beta strand repeat-containing protein [Candidatus Izemoplasmatales bacterium]|nr:DUF4097 family beta strand repeat-containing protein [Candidatus Izemoplasmatales bacterium]